MGDAATPVVGRAEHLVGREAEQARIDAFAAGVAEGARALYLRGEPGVGKTTLWRHAVERCRSSGHEVLLARPAEEEMPLPLVGLADLFERVGLDPVVLAADADPIARGRGVLEALRRLGERGPAVLAIDDVQWLDSLSARSLRYAVRRLDAEPIGLLATIRPGADVVDPLAATSALPPGRHEALFLGPLGLDALRRVLAATVATISRPTLRRIHEVSGGNPLYAIELARGLPSDEGAHRGSGPIPLPGSLQGAIARRLEQVAPQLWPLLETTAALTRASVRELRETLPGSGVEGLLAEAQQAGLLVVEDDLEVRFSHPLVASAVYARMETLARRSLHSSLAERALTSDGRARHLALSTEDPDPAVARLLEEAAERARDGGAFDLGAEFARHAVRLTPPADVEDATRRTVLEVEALAAAGEVSRALALADELIAGLPPGADRVEALLQRAALEDDDLETGEALLVRALADAGDDELLRGRVLDQLGWLRGVFRGDLRGGIECAREALAIAERVGDADFRMSAAAGLSNMEALAGSPRPDLIARAVGLEQEIGRPLLWAGPRVLQAEQQLWLGELAAARSVFETALAGAARSGNERWRSYCLYDLASVECAAGNPVRAEELVREAMEAARDSEDAHVEAWIFHRLALVAAWLGRADEARAAAGHRLEQATARGERPGIARARAVLGLLALSEGDARTAADELTEAVRLLEEMAFAHPGAIPALPDAIDALALRGDVPAAEALFARLEQQAAALDSAWALAAVERARCSLLLARGEVDGAAEAGASAQASFDCLGHRPDAARAALERGRALLRGGQRLLAADVLADARGRFAAMGAVLWEARAAEALERAAPGRAAGALTEAEQRVATCVAAGMRNREIGQTLFMSVASVEAHLTRIYRKLEIRSRSELARLVAAGMVEVAAGEGD
jgi:DNA-binding CsgD family transcriptional regulator